MGFVVFIKPLLNFSQGRVKGIILCIIFIHIFLDFNDAKNK